MNPARLKAIGKLVFFLGAPLGFLLALFGSGVYCGVTHRHAITSFERDTLGLDVEVPPAPAPGGASLNDLVGSLPRPTMPELPRPASPSPSPQPGTSATPPAAPAADPPPAAQPPAGPPTKVDAVTGTLADRLAMPVRVKVKVLVDDELVRAHPDWIDYVQRSVDRASAIYQEQFGITLELASVGRWPIATAGLGAAQLLADLQTRPRESADVLFGLTARPLDDRIAGEAETPASDSPFNGTRGVVYAVPGLHDAHLPTLLHELGHLFGALDVTDPVDPAYQAGSWMSYAPIDATRGPWIDADNRARVLVRKDKPFAPDAPSTPPGAPAEPTDPVGEPM